MIFSTTPVQSVLEPVNRVCCGDYGDDVSDFVCVFSCFEQAVLTVQCT